MQPLLEMWIRPRDVVRRLVEENPEKGVVLLALVGGICHVLDRASGRSAGDQLPFWAILLLVAVFGPLAGLVKLHVGAALVHWTGRWLGGVGTPLHLRTAIAWGSVPMIVVLALWFPLLFIIGGEMFTDEMPRTESDLRRLALLLGSVGVQAALEVWSLVISVKAIAQIQAFSAWRALGNLVLAGMVVLVPVLALAGLALLLRT